MQRTDFSLRTSLRALWWSTTAPLALLGVAGAYLGIGSTNALVLLAIGAGLTGVAGWVWQTSGPRKGLTGTVAPPQCGRRCRPGRRDGPRRSTRRRRRRPRGMPCLHRVLAVRTSSERGGAADPGACRTAGATGHAGSGDPAAGPASAVSAVSSLDTPALCWIWRASFSRLSRSDSSTSREHLAGLRMACLEELEQRDPGAFHRWLPTARAASDPFLRFFCRQPHP